MLRSIKDYIEIVGDEVISDIYKKAQKLYSKHICNALQSGAMDFTDSERKMLS